ncbi:hypothetical protein DPU22_15470 [Salmonella enterica subsp. enterica serovar Newport]|uniref:Uncharacterized protein n=1 Tax=Salmonella enterica I TaxID=59201 RepID=A0A3V2NXI4_SALET|nr:hypothetical protein [Salmonella enterica]EAA7254620.1 hypothetical protein [Salmonella enterica subsp. enterica serovar Newport]EAB9752353.1 hypothetical protein [Salmonella enterica subsp. salamae]EBW9943426.1 hypothetical protein [Salmonella enterica subsp. enterica serovar Give]ECR1919509.1 hypothetical protein [Salmonella enterica subsp. enterica serovar Johannesburg]EDT6458650.1 hypothetical protein [Salmonella enterica subsp. enterica]EEM6847930.1 hypothetical protein [Salmonella en
MKIKPYINAGNLTPGELRSWILELAKNAEIAGWGTGTSVRKLQSAELSLRSVMDDLSPRINFLGSEQIIRSEDHSSEVAEALNTLRITFAAVRDIQRTILSLISQLQEIDSRIPDENHRERLPECEEQGQGKLIRDQ